jgi:DNA (cytosine-5)-methyltransferase 1
LTQGFKLAGFHVAVAVDNDENVEQTYKFNHAEVHFIKDKVESITGGKILDALADKGFSSVDTLIGGPPCRSIDLKGFYALRI